MDVLLIGHSFIRRLKDWALHHDLMNLNIDDRLRIHWLGIGGATIANMTAPKSLWRHIHHITNVQAKIVCLDIGSNDLCHIDVSPDNLVHAIGQFVDQCHNLGTRLVIVTEILPRANVHDQQYNENVYQANILLKTATASHSHCIFLGALGTELYFKILNRVH